MSLCRRRETASGVQAWERPKSMTANATASLNVKASVRNGPIRWLVVGGALLIAAIMIGTTMMADNFRERALISHERELENTVLLLARHFDHQLRDFTVIQRSVVTQIQLAGIATPELFRKRMASLEWHDLLHSRIGAYTDIAGVNLVDSEGVLINSSESWPVRDLNISDRAFFKAFKSGSAAAPVLIELVQSRFSGEWATVIGLKVTGLQGEFLGVVTRAITPAHFEQFFASVALGQDAAISMLDRDGTLLARYPHVEEMIGRTPKTGLVRQQKLFDTGHDTGRLSSPIDGQERLVSAPVRSKFPS